MDHNRFDAMARSIGTAVSRRRFGGIVSAAGLGTVVGALTLADVNAKKKRRKKGQKQSQTACTPNCSDRTCGSDGCGGFCGTCDAGQVCSGGTCCVPEPRGATCGGRCGMRTNNCGQPVECAKCADGRACLSNGTCAFPCADTNDCNCSLCSRANVEGQRHCSNGGLLSPITTCTSTIDCPPGSHCEDMGGGGVCFVLCV